MVRKKKGKEPAVEVAAQTPGAVRGAATRSARVARHLLRHTRLLTREAARQLPVVSTFDTTATDGHITLALPETPRPDERTERAEELARQVADARARAERAEHAAAWLRARLRAERSRHRTSPQLDVAALSADLARELARLHASQPHAVQRIVQRVLAAHGLSADHMGDRTARDGVDPGTLLPWTQEQQELLARQVLARAPDVADASYVYRVLAVAAGRRHLTLPELMRTSGLTSAMARRRLRLTVEALTALGALTAHDGAYALNRDWSPAGPAARSQRS